jgi:hypothetical protein
MDRGQVVGPKGMSIFQFHLIKPTFNLIYVKLQRQRYVNFVLGSYEVVISDYFE